MFASPNFTQELIPLSPLPAGSLLFKSSPKGSEYPKNSSLGVLRVVAPPNTP